MCIATMAVSGYEGLCLLIYMQEILSKDEDALQTLKGTQGSRGPSDGDSCSSSEGGGEEGGEAGLPSTEAAARE